MCGEELDTFLQIEEWADILSAYFANKLNFILKPIAKDKK